MLLLFRSKNGSLVDRILLPGYAAPSAPASSLCTSLWVLTHAFFDHSFRRTPGPWHPNASPHGSTLQPARVRKLPGILHTLCLALCGASEGCSPHALRPARRRGVLQPVRRGTTRGTACTGSSGVPGLGWARRHWCVGRQAHCRLPAPGTPHGSHCYSVQAVRPRSPPQHCAAREVCGERRRRPDCLLTCSPAAAAPAPSRPPQVRRSSYHDVVKQIDISRFADISGIQGERRGSERARLRPNKIWCRCRAYLTLFHPPTPPPPPNPQRKKRHAPKF